ncbi:hypothetical protein FSP39_002165 [Pinctada imbricata]|uniref:Amino acid transporter n=1 Tax=Pinctada imbricata TaxID=66713 RepID=A0AA88YMV1_PINIB|nr:hypothetical protein FSP39_002165 [Pinctada imbricata]
MDQLSERTVMIPPNNAVTANSEQQPKVDTKVSMSFPDDGGGYSEKFQNFATKCCRRLKDNLILVLLLGSVILGCIIGFAARSSGKFTKREIMYLQFPGELLMRMLKMLILPLIISSLIAGIAGLDAKTCGKMGLRTIVYFATTTMISVILGIIMAVSIRPGDGAKRDDLKRYGEAAKLTTADTFLDLISGEIFTRGKFSRGGNFREIPLFAKNAKITTTRKFPCLQYIIAGSNHSLLLWEFPYEQIQNLKNKQFHVSIKHISTYTRTSYDKENPEVSSSSSYRTKLSDVTEEIKQKETVNISTNQNGSVYYVTSVGETFYINATNATSMMVEIDINKTWVNVPGPGSTGQVNILGLVVFSVCMGVILGRMGDKGKPLMDFCNCVFECTMKLFIVFIWYSPVGITFLIAGKIVAMEDFGVLLTQVGLYFLTVLCGLFIHGSIILPLLFFLCTRRNPYKFIYGILPAIATAFGTSSSSATMPVTLHCLEHVNHIDPRVCSFVIPVGATINMDGTALYEAVAALFIAQVNNANMSFGNIITISITATAASIGAAGVPQAGLVTMVIVLSAVGLPIEDVTLILVVDWFLDRFRTLTNVTGDSLGAGIVHYLSLKELPPLNKEQEMEEKMANNVLDPRKENDAMTAV